MSDNYTWDMYTCLDYVWKSHTHMCTCTHGKCGWLYIDYMMKHSLRNDGKWLPTTHKIRKICWFCFTTDLQQNILKSRHWTIWGSAKICVSMWQLGDHICQNLGQHWEHPRYLGHIKILNCTNPRFKHAGDEWTHELKTRSSLQLNWIWVQL